MRVEGGKPIRRGSGQARKTPGSHVRPPGVPLLPGIAPAISIPIRCWVKGVRCWVQNYQTQIPTHQGLDGELGRTAQPNVPPLTSHRPQANVAHTLPASGAVCQRPWDSKVTCTLFLILCLGGMSLARIIPGVFRGRWRCSAAASESPRLQQSRQRRS